MTPAARAGGSQEGRPGRRCLALALTALVGAGLAGCATRPARDAAATAPAPAPLPPPSGPKKRIAVAKFDAAGNFVAVYGSWDIGGGLAAQLTTALIASGHFIVVERAELASVLREQEMSVQKIVSKEAAVQLSRVMGAQLLVKGAVTEFEQKAGGGGLRLGISAMGAIGEGGAGVGGQRTRGVVGMDIRLIDTSTGQVLQAHRTEAQVDQGGVSADINAEQVTLGGELFDKTVLGQATRKAIDDAVRLIVHAMEPVPWAAAVVDVAADQVYVSAGASSGLKPGDVFRVSTVVRELTDPSSGALLGVEEKALGEVRVERVEDRYSIARMTSPFQTKRGDLVTLPAR